MSKGVMQMITEARSRVGSVSPAEAADRLTAGTLSARDIDRMVTAEGQAMD